MCCVLGSVFGRQDRQQSVSHALSLSHACKPSSRTPDHRSEAPTDTPQLLGVSLETKTQQTRTPALPYARQCLDGTPAGLGWLAECRLRAYQQPWRSLRSHVPNRQDPCR